MKKDRYVYPAVFDYAEDGISVEFPDLPGAITCGDTDEEALRMARECMALHIYGMERDGDDIPEPTPAKTLSKEPQQVVVLVDVWMPPFRDEMANKAVKKTLTIPKWLDDIAAENNVNYSHILQDALKTYLGVNKRP
ncbi:HicB family protein [Paenibacillus marchantiophytorum]|uniref:HicB family protein n=1 Tax=Paenibacillus marchantiophytorum TaxID=1619310 RepID=A0ABQ1FCD5_9BACL|nr:type II toxin-antitoxin system HicB family antitoxin [Paenibacillus marchantiophytorum]GGA06592.1 HicB family protein [Paenibacillus marchantiophytorum]